MNRIFLAALVASAFALAAPHPALAQGRGTPGTSRPAEINKSGAIMLIRAALIAVDQANKTGNYTALRDFGAPAFKAANSAARLADIFAPQRRANLDLSGVAVIEPQLNSLPRIDANGLMSLVGFFPSVPQQINFELQFAPVDGQWRMFGVNITVGQSGPSAPGGPTPAAVAPAPEAAAPAAPAKPAPRAAAKPAPRRQPPAARPAAPPAAAPEE